MRTNLRRHWMMPALALLMGASALLVASAPTSAEALCMRMPSWYRNPAYQKAQTLVSQGKVTEAIPYFRKVARSEAQAKGWIAAAWYRAGYKAYRAKDFETAVKNFRESLRVRPQYTSAAVALFRALAASDQLPTAFEEMKRFSPNVRNSRWFKRTIKGLIEKHKKSA